LVDIRTEPATKISVRGKVANFRFDDWRSNGGVWRNGGDWCLWCRLLSFWFFSGLLGVGVCGFLGEGVRRHEPRHQ
jgi:hypothetical protein